MSSHGRSRAEARGLAGEMHRGRRRALTGEVLVGLLAAVAEVLPVEFVIYGGVLLQSWLQHRWDATWNDGDAWIAAAAGVVLVVIALVAGAAARTLARGGGLPPRATVLIATGASLAAAVFGSADLIAKS